MQTPFDELDHKIIDRLFVDARSSNREIAREFGLTEGSIRARLKRLLESKSIRVTAVTNARYLRNPVLAYLWIEVDSTDEVSGVARALAALREITFVATLLGRSDILAMTLVEGSEDLASFLHTTVDRIPGVRRIQYTLSHTFIKHDYRWCAIVDKDAPATVDMDEPADDMTVEALE
jgi:Lrp/AsnC family transcriptional regulator for asnA, asnC and gidA